MVAWILQFYNRVRNKVNIKENIDSAKFQDAEVRVLKMVQSTLTAEQLSNFRLFKTDDGLIRVDTKLSLSSYHEDFVKPILVPGEHILIQKMIHEVHDKSCHAGIQILSSILRERFWVLKGNKIIKNIISKCVICLRQRSKVVEVPAAPLPADRVTIVKCFQVSGADLLGPLILKAGAKSWVILFTCGVYRAVHLELITSLSTDSFIQGFRRFMARRGRISTIYTDNATNFHGTKNLLDNLNIEEIKNDFLFQRIEWKNIPPSSPWYGGWWERLVRVVKDLLKRVIGSALLTYEELNTVLCDIEAIINSRPLTYMLTSGEEFTPLTPAHFIQPIVNTNNFDLDKVEEQHLRQRVRYLQNIRNDLRTRFRKEYLSNLILDAKMKNKYSHLKVGDIVLIQTDGVKRIRWPLGKIIEAIPGKDGEVRVVKVKTSNGLLVRPLQRLCPLEVSSENPLIFSVSSFPHIENNIVKIDEVDSSDKESIESESDVTSRVGRKIKKPVKLNI